MRIATALTCLLLAACGHETIKIDPMPEIVYVPVDRYVSLCVDDKGKPDPKCKLLAACYDEAPREQSFNEAKRLANLRKESIAECNGRWGRVRKLQEQKP